ncbi:MAG: hypothetical protein WA113_01375 [Desulfitobacteriaceae bacterium]
MIKLKPRCIATIVAVLILAVGSYVGWQIHLGQQLAKQYTIDAQKLAQITNSNEVKPVGSSNPSAPTPNSQASSPISPPSISPPSPTPTSLTPASPTNPHPPSSPAGTPPTEDYKKIMSSTYQQTLQAMQNVKANTLALQGKGIGLSAYRASILQSQATFTTAEAFVLANPPTEEKLKASYQEFLSGISLAKNSMSVVLNGLSSLSPSSLYAAREMGKTAQQQVSDAYAHF